MVENDPYKIQLRSVEKKKYDSSSVSFHDVILSEVTIECIDYHTFRALNSAVRQILEKEERYANKNNEQED